LGLQPGQSRDDFRHRPANSLCPHNSPVFPTHFPSASSDLFPTFASDGHHLDTKKDQRLPEPSLPLHSGTPTEEPHRNSLCHCHPHPLNSTVYQKIKPIFPPKIQFRLSNWMSAVLLMPSRVKLRVRSV